MYLEKSIWQYWVGKHPNYYPLPPDLEAALKEDSLLIWVDSMNPYFFEGMLTGVLNHASYSVLPYGPPAYHNGSHFNDVVKNVRLLLDASDELIPDGVAQMLLFAAATHDFAHQGATFRKDAEHGIPLPELGTDIATEQVSAILADNLAAQYELPPGVRLFIVRCIHATTFGNPAITPQSSLEKLLAAADVGWNDTFEDWLLKGVAAIYGERPAKPAPTTLSGWIANRLGFIDYYLVNFVTPDKPQFVPETIKLGWHEMLASHRQKLQSVKDCTADPTLVNLVKSMLPASVDLTA